MVRVGQYVRSLLAGGLAANIPANEGYEPELERLGVVVQVKPAEKIIVVEDIFGNQHDCHLNEAVRTDLSEVDEFIRDWANKRARELGAASA